MAKLIIVEITYDDDVQDYTLLNDLEFVDGVYTVKRIDQ